VRIIKGISEDEASCNRLHRLELSVENVQGKLDSEFADSFGSLKRIMFADI
jgi:hypothetical protein